MSRIPAHVTLRALRTSRGLNSVVFAARLKDRGVKVDPDHILAVELGHRRAGLELRVAWADELGISPSDIHFEAELRDLLTLADADSDDDEKAVA